MDNAGRKKDRESGRGAQVRASLAVAVVDTQERDRARWALPRFDSNISRLVHSPRNKKLGNLRVNCTNA